jgi:hypothetical protein
VRGLLRRNGADVSCLSPSTRLEPYLRSHYDVFCIDIPKAFPGQLPEPSVNYGPIATCLWALAGLGFPAGWVLLFVGLHAPGPWAGNVMLAGALLIAGSLPAAWVARFTRPRKLCLGEYETFRDLCMALAAHHRRGTALAIIQGCGYAPSRARAGVVEPVTILGRPCRKAAVFRAIASILGRAGADVSRLAPSSLLEPYLRGQGRAIVLEVGRLARDPLPPIKEEYPWGVRHIRHACKFALYASAPVYLVAIFGGALMFGERVMTLVGVGAIATTLLLAGVMFLCDQVRPRTLRLGDCRTVRDLCELLASQHRGLNRGPGLGFLTEPAEEVADFDECVAIQVPWEARLHAGQVAQAQGVHRRRSTAGRGRKQ